MKEIIIFAAVVILLIWMRVESDKMLDKIRKDEEKRRNELDVTEKFYHETADNNQNN